MRYAIALLLWMAAAATPGYADPRSDLAQARHDLAISEQVLARGIERAEAARADPAMDPEQRQRLDDYVARVRALVVRNQERVRNLAQAAGTQPAVAGVAMAPQAATQVEEVAALETRLGGSLAEFDQLLLEEARRARTRGATGASGSLGGYGSGAAGEDASRGSGTGSRTSGAKDRGKDRPDPQQSADAPETPGKQTAGTDRGGSGAAAAPPGDVGDGRDDDIVESQIRKAAESERDPELRERLWDEYRKYKQGSKG